MATGDIPELIVSEIEKADAEDESKASPPPRQINRLSASPCMGLSSSEFELTSSASSSISEGMDAALDIPVAAADCDQLRRNMRRSLGASTDPMWQQNRILGNTEDPDDTKLEPSSQDERRPAAEAETTRPSYWTASPYDTVLLRRWRNASIAPQTVPAMFKKMMEKNKTQLALVLPPAVPPDEEDEDKNEATDEQQVPHDPSEDKPADEPCDVIKSWTYREYYNDCILAAKGFIKNELEAHHSVCILADPSPNWHIANMAAIMAGGMSVAIDQRSSPETCLKIVNHCSADIIVVDKPHQLEKILKVIPQMTCVKTLIYCNGVIEREGLPSGINCLTWDELLNAGRSTDGELLQSRMDQLNPANCCSVIYTTNCDSKLQGVMLSHDNITWSCKRFVEATRCRLRKERVLSHMSLADINYQMIDIYAMIASGGCSYFVPVRATVMDTLNKVHPSIFLGGFMQWERIKQWLQCLVKEKEMAWKQDIRTHLKDNIGLMDKIKFKLKINTLDECVDKAFKHKILKEAGLEKCHLPLSMSTADPVLQSSRTFFQSMGLSLWEQYGTAETTGPVVISRSVNDYYTSTGKCYRGTNAKFESEELLVNGRQLFMGYLSDSLGTANVFTDSCWLRTGVCGHKEQSGTVNISGRLQDMITLSSGEKVAPLPLENTILKELPIANEVFVFGEGREYLTCLVTLEVTIEQEIQHGSLVSYLDPVVQTSLLMQHCRASTLDDFDNPRKAVAMTRLMKKALDIEQNKSHLIRRIALLRPLAKKPIPSNLERSKKREYILEHYGSLIEELYQQPLVDKIVASVLRSP